MARVQCTLSIPSTIPGYWDVDLSNVKIRVPEDLVLLQEMIRRSEDRSDFTIYAHEDAIWDSDQECVASFKVSESDVVDLLDESGRLTDEEVRNFECDSDFVILFTTCSDDRVCTLSEIILWSNLEA